MITARFYQISNQTEGFLSFPRVTGHVLIKHLSLKCISCLRIHHHIIILLLLVVFTIANNRLIKKRG